MSKIPCPPYRYLSGNFQDLLDLTSFNCIVSENDKNRQDAFDRSSKIKAALIRSRASFEWDHSRQDGIKPTETILEELIKEVLPLSNKQPRVANLSSTFSDYIREKAYRYFLNTGTLLPQSSISEKFSDEEYLMGIIMLNRDISRYCIGRATERDVDSVILARNLVSRVLDYLMKFDFRNGNLRRRYDGVKYDLKTCETILYELSVTGADVTINHEKKGNKRLKYDGNDIMNKIDTNLFPEVELEDLRKRVVRKDDLREILIKNCRDAQKAAKQAIYALHRDDIKKAEKMIIACEKSILDELKPVVDEEPMLHYGSYANVLEEYAEAKLYFSWLEPEQSVSEFPCKPGGKLLSPSGFTPISLEPEEYVGGLMDLTGEIGRYAVKKGTQRDAESVKLCLRTNMSILFSLESLSRLPGGANIEKKREPLKRSIEKLEKMLYELSLMEATGRNVVSDAIAEP